MEERRNIMRWHIKRQAQVKFGDAQQYSNCRVNDINLKGLQVFSPGKLQKDKFAKLSIILSPDCVLDVEAWIAWSKWQEGESAYGFYFTKIKDSDKEKLFGFIYKNYPQEVCKQWWQGTAKGGEIMSRQNYEDKRIFERLPLELPLRFLSSSAAKEGKGKTQDISAKGIGMVTKEQLPLKASVELWLEIPDKGEPLYTRGEVIWSKHLESDKYRSGINLESADLMGMSRALRTA